MLVLSASLFISVAEAQSTCPGLRAANGKCANLEAVEDAQQRAMVITTVRVSDIGTPIGQVGDYVRLFQDQTSKLYGLPNITYILHVYDPDTFRIVRTR
jgi:hypothetical protein